MHDGRYRSAVRNFLHALHYTINLWNLTHETVRFGTQRHLARHLSVQPQQRLVQRVHDGVDVRCAAGEMPATAQRDLLCTSSSCPVSIMISTLSIHPGAGALCGLRSGCIPDTTRHGTRHRPGILCTSAGQSLAARAFKIRHSLSGRARSFCCVECSPVLEPGVLRKAVGMGGVRLLGSAS